MTIFTAGICRTHFFDELRIGLDAPDVGAAQRLCGVKGVKCGSRGQWVRERGYWVLGGHLLMNDLEWKGRKVGHKRGYWVVIF